MINFDFSKIIDFIKDKDQSVFIGYLFSILMFLSSIIQVFFINNFMHRIFVISMRVSSACMILVYKKVIMSPKNLKLLKFYVFLFL
jgi:hypothetical protein